MELTSDLIDEVEEGLKRGLSRLKACKRAGVSRAVLKRWEKKAAVGEEPFHSFIGLVERAEAAFEADCLGTIEQSPDWRAKAWALERVFPDRYAQRIKLDVRQELERVLTIAERVLDGENYNRFLSALDDEDAGAPADGGEPDQAPSQIH